MNILNTTFKTTLITAALSVSVGTALADGQSGSVHLAQAQTNQGAPSDRTGATPASGVAGSDARGAKEQSGASGNAGTSGSDSGQSGTSGASANDKSRGGQAAKADGLPPGHPPVYMIIPLDVANRDNAMRQGCWARIYDGENFKGDALTLVGPVALSDLQGPFGLNWDDRVKSIETGKKAKVMVYDNEDFRDPVTTFKPGQKVADVSKRTGFFDEFASIRIDC